MLRLVRGARGTLLGVAGEGDTGVLSWESMAKSYSIGCLAILIGLSK